MRNSGVSHRSSIRALIVLTAVFGFLMTACGGGPPTQSAREPGSPGARPDLTRFLLLPNEEPGWAPTGNPEIISSVSAFAEDEEDSAVAEKRLREEGFEAFVVQPLEGKETAGVTNVMLFTTAEGANRELEHFAGPQLEQELAEGTIKLIERFTVPGVPSARGFTASKPDDEHDVGNVVWSQGRCVLVLGNEVQSGEPLVEPLRTGVKAIYDRTDGSCP